MPIGERLKMARHTAGLSQRALAEATGVSAMAISKYERGLDLPSSGVLIRLAKALGLKVEYFLRPVTITLSAPAYRRRASLPRKQEKSNRERRTAGLSNGRAFSARTGPLSGIGSGELHHRRDTGCQWWPVYGLSVQPIAYDRG